MSGYTHSVKIFSAVAGIIAFGSFCAAVSAAEETPAQPGVMRGVVVDAESGQAIVGSYVGVGEFGDSGGSNRSRVWRFGGFESFEAQEARIVRKRRDGCGR